MAKAEMATAGVFLLPDYAGQVANTFDNMLSNDSAGASSPGGQQAHEMAVPFGHSSDDGSMVPGTSDNMSGSAPSYEPASMLWRCLDGEHPTVCDRCHPPPAPDEEANYELVGDPGKKNGEKKLRTLLQKTIEWTDFNCRQEAAAAAERDGKPEFAKTIRKRDVPGLRKGHFFFLMRHWGFKSDVWKLKQTIVNAQKAKEARAEQDRLVQAHLLSLQMQRTDLQNSASPLANNDVRYEETDGLDAIDVKMEIANEQFDAMLRDKAGGDASESSIASGVETLYYGVPMLDDVDQNEQRRIEDEVLEACAMGKEWNEHSLENDQRNEKDAMACGQADSPGCCSSCLDPCLEPCLSDIVIRDQLLPPMEDFKVNPIVKSSWTTVRLYINEKLAELANAFLSSGAHNNEYVEVSDFLWGVRKDYHFSCEEEITSKVLEATRLRTTLKLMRMEKMDLLTELAGPLFEGEAILACPVTPLLNGMGDCFHHLMLPEGRSMQMKALTDLGKGEIVSRTDVICQAFADNPSISVPPDALAYFHTVGAMHGKRMVSYARSLLAWSKTQTLDIYFTAAFSLQEFMLEFMSSLSVLITRRRFIPVNVMSGYAPDSMIQILGDTIIPR